MLRTFVCLACLALFAAININSYAEADTLYQRLGGKPVVEAVVSQALGKIAADPAVNQSFNGVDLKKLDEKVAIQLCALTGGGCEYKGDNMQQVHAGMNITEKEFYALVEALREALDSHGVGEREKNELLKILAPMKPDIVTK